VAIFISFSRGLLAALFYIQAVPGKFSLAGACPRSGPQARLPLSVASRDDWIWIAGFFDGEGSITLATSANNLQVALGQKDQTIIREVIRLFGGKFHVSPRPEGKTIWEVRWHPKTAETFLEGILPFEVVSPGFIPEDFCRGLYIHVIDPCLWPTEDFDCGLSIQVMQTWAAWVENESLEFSQRASLSLVQTPSSMGTGDVPTEVGGYPATIDYVGSESDPPFLVTLHWEIDGMYFILSGWIASPLTEEVIYEVAASVEVD